MNHELPAGFTKNVVGYCEPLSVRPLASIEFKLGTWNGGGEPANAEVEIVKLISGDDRPHGTGLLEETIDADLPDSLLLTHQPLLPGSFARVPGMPSLDSAEISIGVMPTLLRSSRQTIFAMADLLLQVDTNGFYLRWERGEVCLEFLPRLRRWHQITVQFGDGKVALNVAVQPGGLAELLVQDRIEATGNPVVSGDLLFAAEGAGRTSFNGRLEAPEIISRDTVLARWDFSQDMHTQTIVDVSGNGHDGRLLQTPTRAVAGSLWDGTVQSYHVDPSHYGAIHCHEDDLTDAGWQTNLQWQIPEGLDSGQYALKIALSDDESEDYIPFFVRAKPGQPGAPVAYLVPTASYLAYANQRLGFAGGILGATKIHHANDAFLMVHEDVGFSMYEYHRDHSGVHFSSRLRPILNMKPKSGTWAFNADTHLTAWLHALEQPFDVITDEDLHAEGAAALADYRVVITGTHPEYYSTNMRDGLGTWLGQGGRLMYMGGNGFYWRVAFCPDQPGIMEVRRAEDGTRARIAEPGEYYHQFSGEYGGMWRRLGKPPNELVGIGFAAQGFDGGTYYRVQPGALDPRVAFILQDVEAGDTWGAFGNQGGGAAGEEIDRWDIILGSPGHAVVIATSENHRPGMLRVKEEFHMMEPPGDDPQVRADMVFFEVPGGGAVFSTGSISYAGSLAFNDYANEISVITSNVLQRFMDAEPFVMPETHAQQEV